MSLLNDVKLLKGIHDDTQDKLLDLIIQESQERVLSFMNRVAGEPTYKEVPKDLNYVIRDVSIKRFNKLNAEGMSRKSEEGLSLQWESGLLTEHEDELVAYVQGEEEKPQTRFKPLNVSKARFV